MEEIVDRAISATGFSGVVRLDVVLALLAERAAGQRFDELVSERVSAPAAVSASGWCPTGRWSNWTG